MKNKTILLTILSIGVTAFITFWLVIFYLSSGPTNDENIAIGKQIAADLKQNKSSDLLILKSEVEKKYNLEQNDDIKVIVVSDNDNKKSDIFINIYLKPLGPFEVYSLNKDEWYNEE